MSRRNRIGRNRFERGRGTGRAGSVGRQPLERLEDRRLMAAGTVDLQADTALNRAVLSQVVQTNDQALIFTATDHGNTGTTARQVTRFTTAGAVDTTYGTGGSITPAGNPLAIAIGSDNKLVVVGNDGKGDATVTRYTTAGQIDTSYGTNGVYTYRFADRNPVPGYTPSDSFVAALVDSQGRLVIGDEGIDEGEYQLHLQRLTATGTLDTTFGTGGIADAAQTGTGDPDPYDNPYNTVALAQAPDGTYLSAGTRVALGLTRFSTGGAVTAYAGVDLGTLYGGALKTGAPSYAIPSIAVQSTGAIVFGGTATLSISSHIGFVGRATAALAADTTFLNQELPDPGTHGQSPVPTVLAVAVTAGDRVLALAEDSTDNVGPANLFRLTAGGQTDPTYAVVTAQGTTIQYGYANLELYQDQSLGLSVLSNGEALVCGDAQLSTLRLVRVTTDAAPTASISGFVYNTVTGTGFAGGTVYADANGNGKFDAGEPAAAADPYGRYTLAGLPAGTYAVRETGTATGYTLAAPSTGVQSVTLTAGQAATGSSFGLQPQGKVDGTIADPDSDDDPLTGTFVAYDDLNNNGKLDAGEPSVTAYSSGDFELPNLPYGTATVRLVPPAGSTYAVTQPATGYQTATLTPGGNVPQLTFGVTLGGVTGTASFSGFVYDATEANQPNDENGVAGTTVYVDLNNNGRPDAGEPNAASVRYTGHYVIPSVASGTYAVRLANVTAGYTPTQPASAAQTVTFTAGKTTDFLNFGIAQTSSLPTASLSGYLYNTVTGIGFAGGTVYLDANKNGTLDAGETSVVANQYGAYTLTGLAPGVYQVRETGTAAGYTLTAPASGVQTVTLPNGQTAATGVSFGLTPAATSTASVAGYVYNAANGTGFAGGTVYVDANNNGTLDGGEKSVAANQYGYYALGGLAAGAYTLRVANVASGYSVTAPSGGAQAVTLANAQAATGVSFGLTATAAATASITGYVYNSNTGTGFAGGTVYLDANNNGTLDGGERSVAATQYGYYTFAGLAAGTYAVRLTNVQAPYAPTSPASAALSVTLTAGQASANDSFGLAPQVASTSAFNGYVYNTANANKGFAGATVYIDANNNGQLDATEPTAVASQYGYYSFAGLPYGTYTVRLANVAAGYTATAPAGGVQTVTLIAGQTMANVSFGLTPTAMPGSFSGYVFNAATGNGFAGSTVYLDGNNDGIQDNGEYGVAVDQYGHYSIGNLPVGTYVVRATTPAGYKQTFPTAGYQSVTITSGATLANVSFGQTKIA